MCTGSGFHLFMPTQETTLAWRIAFVRIYCETLEAIQFVCSGWISSTHELWKKNRSASADRNFRNPTTAWWRHVEWRRHMVTMSDLRHHMTSIVCVISHTVSVCSTLLYEGLAWTLTKASLLRVRPRSFGFGSISACQTVQHTLVITNQATVKPMTAEVVGLIMLPHHEEAKK